MMHARLALPELLEWKCLRLLLRQQVKVIALRTRNTRDPVNELVRNTARTAVQFTI